MVAVVGCVGRCFAVWATTVWTGCVFDYGGGVGGVAERELAGSLVVNNYCGAMAPVSYVNLFQYCYDRGTLQDNLSRLCGRIRN
jgi:hypothetical protein